MRSVEQYLRNAQSRVMDSHSSADGFIDDDLNFTGESDFFGADGGQVVSAPAPVSQPYIVNIVNSSAAVANFDILGSYQYAFNAGWSAGNLVIGTITISSGIPGVTYQEMLQQFSNAPFSVGQTYLRSATAGQIMQVISLNTKDANGSIAQKPFVPLLDPYQNQTDVVIFKNPYRIDGYTKLTIAQVQASASLSVYIYPSDNINLARGLAGRPVGKNFANPGIIKAQPVKVVS